MGNFSFLGNRYWILRHGKSIPNEKGLIVSSLENGTLPEFQLAAEGVNQARSAGESFLKELKENNIPLENVQICYSPFSRTRHTAEVVTSVLNLPFEGPQCKVMEELRERFFGPSFELQSHDKYAEIWDHDEKDPFMQPEEGGESVADVVSRLAIAVETMEKEFQGCVVLVVSHGDPLQILQTILHATNQQKGPAVEDFMSRLEAVKVPSILSQHRKYALLTGELRRITAQVVASVLNLPFEGPQCKVIEELREHYYGPSFELQSHDEVSIFNLHQIRLIWAVDEKDPFMKPEEGGDSVADVVSRLATAVETMEKEFQGCVVLVVSHGDPLQILQTVLHAMNEIKDLKERISCLDFQRLKVPSILPQHRRKFALLTGELRPII
ncbi:Histidine phosphatase superfamily [Macleaya cordata]|uniref:Histidine phosphatase superfamily n=1 Tax=Macleaya cordata TaxID=56857 RepID=A0A200PQX8_MACCD|nr:Histidine phosphatase superfamily [Macleaya cordata]